MESFIAVLTDILPAFTMAASVSAIVLVIQNTLRGGFKYSLRIAVIGMPRSGKTTLITSVFDSIMSGKIAKYVSVTGEETVNRLTTDMKRMRSGENLGPTEDKDVFAYRYTMDRNNIFFKRKYDVEIADFPGEYSENITSDISRQIETPGVYRKEFFSWIVRADKYIFVVDAEKYRLEKTGIGAENYLSDIEIAFKNAVLMLKQEMLDEKVYKRSLLLVFTKCDALYFSDIEFDELSQIGKGVGYNSPYFHEFENLEVQSVYTNRCNMMLKDYSNLIEFFKNNFRDTKICLHSSYCQLPEFLKANREIVAFSSPLENLRG